MYQIMITPSYRTMKCIPSCADQRRQARILFSTGQILVWLFLMRPLITVIGDLAERFNRAHLGEADYSTVYHSPELGILSTPYPSWRAYKHHQWVIFTPEAVRFFRTDPDALNFLSFAEHTFIPDEHYFGTGEWYLCFILTFCPSHDQLSCI